MAAMESLSSWLPQPNSQPEPPIAQAPNPIGVINKSELPSRRVSTIAPSFGSSVQPDYLFSRASVLHNEMPEQRSCRRVCQSRGTREAPVPTTNKIDERQQVRTETESKLIQAARSLPGSRQRCSRGLLVWAALSAQNGRGNRIREDQT